MGGVIWEVYSKSKTTHMLIEIICDRAKKTTHNTAPINWEIICGDLIKCFMLQNDTKNTITAHSYQDLPYPGRAGPGPSSLSMSAHS